MRDKINNVTFIDKKTENLFGELKSGKYEDKQLFDFINRAIKDLKENPACGIHIPKRLWPKEYLTKFNVNNLWKYDLPSSWRLIYTIQANEVMIISVILEWFNHKDYEKRFKY